MAAVLDTIKSTIAENFGGPSHSLANPEHQFSLDEVPDLSGKVGVVTGGSRGIGYACTHTLLSRNVSKLFIISRAQDAVNAALSEISSSVSPEASQKVTWLQCDMADWKAVAETSNKIAKETDRVDILINDAARGIMTYQLTDYGVDRHKLFQELQRYFTVCGIHAPKTAPVAVNHMGHVILTSHLLPLLKNAANKGDMVRIVMLGSNAHQATPSDCKFATLDELNQDLGPNGQYGRSKLAQMLYAKYLNKHLTSKHPNILANSVHPGFVDTKMSRDDIHEPYPVGGYAMSVGMKPFKKDQFQGCVSAMFAATKTEKSGQYVCPPAIPESGNDLAQSEDLAEALMVLTKQVVKEKTFQDSVANGCPLEFY